MVEPLRLFIAIDLPFHVKALLREVQDQLRADAPSVRWADPGGTHLTLKFLGNVDQPQIDPIVAGMHAAAGAHAPFGLRTADLGVFPHLRRPRVIWLGLAGALGALHALRADVEQHVAPLGFPTEQRAFNPHLTLGRSPKTPTDAELTSIGRAVQRVQMRQHVPFDVHAIVLMRSELTPSGARYTPLTHVDLAATERTQEHV